jgi:hypothetical protein
VHPPGGGYWAAAPSNPSKLKFKKHRISKYRDLKKLYVLSPSQPLKSDDDQYIRIFKYKLIKLKKQGYRTL